MGHFFYSLRVGSLRFARFEQKPHSNRFDTRSDGHESRWISEWCALLIIPKKEKDYVDPSSLLAPCNSHATTHTSWCGSGVSGCGLLALVHHHSTAPETSQDTEVFFSGRCIVSLGLCRGVSVRSPVV
jgi:hypothetical protein